MSDSGISDSLQETLGAFDQGLPGEPLTTDDVAETVDLSRESIDDQLHQLEELGQLQTKKVGGRDRVWWRPPGASEEEAVSRDSTEMLPDSREGSKANSSDGGPPEERSRDSQDDRVDDTDQTPDSERRRESEHELREEIPLVESIFENQRDILYAFDSDGQLLRWNERLESVTGYDADEVESMTPQDFIADSAAGRVSAAIASIQNGEAVTLEAPLETADGETIPYEFSGTPLRDDDGEIVGFTGIGRDMSRHKRLEWELERHRDELEQELEMVYERIDDAFFALDNEWRFTYVNEQAAEVLGRSAGSLIGSSIWELFPDAVDSTFQEHYERAVETQEKQSFEAPYPPLDTWFEVTAYPSESGLSVYFRDITQRKQRERELERYETITQTASDVILTIDSESVIQNVNPAVADVFGYEPSELVGESLLTLMPDRLTDDHLAAMEQYLRTGQRTFDWDYLELPGQHADGTEISLGVSFNEYETQGGHYFTGFIRDITERKQRERELEQYKQLVETVKDGIYALDADERFVMVNDGFCALTGYDREELIGAPAETVYNEDIGPQVQTVMAEVAAGDREKGEVEHDIETKDGRIVPCKTLVERFQVGDGSYGRCGVVRDITDHREFAERLTELTRTSRRLLLAERDTCIGAILAETVTEVFDLPACVVYAHDQVTDRLVPMEESVEPTSAADELSAVPATEESILGQTFVDRSARYVDSSTASEMLPLGTGATKMQVGSFVPLGSHGVLAVGNHEEFGENTQLLIELLAANAEAAWESVTDTLALQRQFDQQETISTLGRSALEDPDIDTLMADAAAAVADVLDNEYCKVLDLDPEAGELLLRQGVGWDEGIVGEATVSAHEAESQAAYTLQTDEPVVVTDLETETRFSGPALLTDHDVRSGISVVIGPSDDPWGILGTHDTVPKQFSKHDASFVQSVANILATAIEHRANQQMQTRQRERLSALVNLNEVVREISDAVISKSTREEIETVVCERLAETGSYEFAWIGTVDSRTQTVELAAEAGVDDYLDDVSITLDPNDDHSKGPTGRALRTGEFTTCQDTQADPQYEPWREQAEEIGYQSSAAIPIEYDGTTYGVLNVYSSRTNAFIGQERTVLVQLGEIVGHAIAAVERQRALMTDDVVELQFYIPDPFEDIDLEPLEGALSLTDIVPIREGEFLVYGTATGKASRWLTDIADQLDHWTAVEIHGDETDEEQAFELRLDEPPVVSTVASVGGTVVEAVLEGGNYSVTIQVPPGSAVKQVTDTIQEAYPTAEMVSHRQQVRDAGISRGKLLALSEELTERQLAVLRASYHAGFFEWPRETAGEDVAESLDVAAPTFHQHLRKAEKKVFDTLFATSAL